MKKRKGISKKLRFEIFKRDRFACGYCGGTPPGVVLEIDHIEPFSKGGACDINNYLTSCFDCNRGKGARNLTAIPKSLSENMEALHEKELQIKEYQKFIKSIRNRENKYINRIAKIYSDNVENYELSQVFKQDSLKKFIQTLPIHEVEDSMYKALGHVHSKEGIIKYFCGICWNKIRGDSFE